MPFDFAPVTGTRNSRENYEYLYTRAALCSTNSTCYTPKRFRRPLRNIYIYIYTHRRRNSDSVGRVLKIVSRVRETCFLRKGTNRRRFWGAQRSGARCRRRISNEITTNTRSVVVTSAAFSFFFGPTPTPPFPNRRCLTSPTRLRLIFGYSSVRRTGTFISW